MSKTAELKSAGTRFVMNSVAWDSYAKMAQVVCTVLASMEGYSTSAQDAATKACDSLLMQRAVVLLIADHPQYAKNCAKAELARILADVNLGALVDATEFSESLAELFCDTLNKVNAAMFEQYHPGYRVSQLVVGKYNPVAGNLPFEAVLKGRGNSRCYKIVGHAHPVLTFDHDGNPSLDWHLSSCAEGATPPSRIGTRVVKDDYQGFVTV
jgi:hypothetical protein